MLSLPLVITHGQRLEVPPPFTYEVLRRHNRNQPERTQFPQRQLRYAVRDLVSTRFAGKRPNYFATANDIMLRLARDAVPVDQRETNTGIIRRNPCAACRLARENSAVAPKLVNRWRKSRKAVQFFVAIHREIKSLRLWKKRNRAH
jgi:hypothetical protein